jgi:hypothetical protein
MHVWQTADEVFPLASMPEPPDEHKWPDENKLIRELRERLASNTPVRLEEVAGIWEPEWGVFNLRFRLVDGREVEVSHGDSYTAITGDRVNFHGCLTTEELARVLFGMLRGTTRYVERRKAGLKVTEHFEVADDPTQIGFHTGGPAFMHRPVLDKLLPVSARASRVDLSFT